MNWTSSELKRLCLPEKNTAFVVCSHLFPGLYSKAKSSVVFLYLCIISYGGQGGWSDIIKVILTRETWKLQFIFFLLTMKESFINPK